MTFFCTVASCKDSKLQSYSHIAGKFLCCMNSYPKLVTRIVFPLSGWIVQ